MTPPADVRRAIDDGAMSPFQSVAIGLCVVLNMLDGFDVLVMAFTASEVAREWGLSGARLGVLLSAGLFGMAAGSLFVAPFADRFGRRAITIACLAVITAGLAGSALAASPLQLATLRVVTGIGVGGILASLNVITSEYASLRWRNTAISLQVTGYPIGATVGGTIAAFLVTTYGWRAAFWFGAAASLVMIPVAVRSLPESLDFLLARQPKDGLARLNTLLAKMGRAPVESLPPRTPEEAAERNPLGRLFAAGSAGATLLAWSAFFLVMFSFYFVTSWTPKLLVAAGLSTRQGITGGVLLNVGGIVGGTLFGVLAARLPLKRLATACFCATAACVALFGQYAASLRAAFPIALAIGVFLFGSMVALYVVTPKLYPAAIRATGMGWAIGIGRIGAILAPFVAGVLVDAGWPTPWLYAAFAVPLVLAVLSVRALEI